MKNKVIKNGDTYKKPIQHQHTMFFILVCLLAFVAGLIFLCVNYSKPIESFAVGGTISGAGTEGNPYIIEDEADLMAFANSANSETYWASGVYVQLGGDISVSSITWTPIGIDDTNAYKGTFDGAGHKITFEYPIEVGVSEYYARLCFGLFAYTGEGAIIKNLGVDWKGGVTLNVLDEATGCIFGGIVADAKDITVDNCTTWGTANINGESTTNNGV